MQHFFGPLALGDVYHDGDKKRRSVSSRRNKTATDLRPDNIAVFTPIAFLKSIISSLPFGGLRQERYDCAGTVVFMADIQSSQSLELRFRVAKHFLESQVCREIAA